MKLKTMLTGLSGAAIAAQAQAQELQIVGQPTEGGLGFQPAATYLAERLQNFDGIILLIITVITIFCGVARLSHIV